MRKDWKALVLFVVAIAVVLRIADMRRPAHRTPKSSGQPHVGVFFSPHGGCTKAIVEELQRAKRVILVQAYSFTSAEIAKALRDARKRGVNVVAILDKTNRTGKYSSATFLRNSDITTLIDDNHAIAHSKVILIDDSIVITGSFNFTNAAEEKNVENLLIIKGMPSVANAYKANIARHAEHASLSNE